MNPIELALAKKYTDRKVFESGAVVIDPTLSKEGQAADAKMVGNMIRAIDLRMTDDDNGNVIISFKEE